MDINERRRVTAKWQEEHPNPTPEDLVKLTKLLGGPPDIDELDASTIRCACNRVVSCGAVQIINTGQMDAVEPVCQPCIRDFAGQARLVCVRCKSVIGWLPPQVDPHGFRIEADKCYHVRACAVCKKDLQKADIIEMMLYYDDQGIPYEKDELDLD